MPNSRQQHKNKCLTCIAALLLKISKNIGNLVLFS
jgi:hypothetical protein